MLYLHFFASHIFVCITPHNLFPLSSFASTTQYALFLKSVYSTIIHTFRTHSHYMQKLKHLLLIYLHIRFRTHSHKSPNKQCTNCINHYKSSYCSNKCYFPPVSPSQVFPMSVLQFFRICLCKLKLNLQFRYHLH